MIDLRDNIIAVLKKIEKRKKREEREEKREEKEKRENRGERRYITEVVTSDVLVINFAAV